MIIIIIIIDIHEYQIDCLTFFLYLLSDYFEITLPFCQGGFLTSLLGEKQTKPFSQQQFLKVTTKAAIESKAKKVKQTVIKYSKREMLIRTAKLY